MGREVGEAGCGIEGGGGQWRHFGGAEGYGGVGEGEGWVHCWVVRIVLLWWRGRRRAGESLELGSYDHKARSLEMLAEGRIFPALRLLRTGGDCGEMSISRFVIVLITDILGMG
jgi:hypothetical protein